MIPCELCGAIGVEPCRTRSGRIAKDIHAVRHAAERRAGPLEAACIRSLEAANWLTAADEVTRSIVLEMCRKIDGTTIRSDQPQMFDDASSDEVMSKDSGRLYYAGATILTYLDRLGLTPAGRRALGIIDDDGKPDDIAQAIAELTPRGLTGARVATSADMDASR